MALTEEKAVKDLTLVFCRRRRSTSTPTPDQKEGGGGEGRSGGNDILLGMKKRGFGIGKWNGKLQK